MVFSGACSEYIDAHSCSEGDALRLSCLIGECMPLGLSGIDWGRVPGQKEVVAVERDKLVGELAALVSVMGAEMNDEFIVMNIDDAFPLLKTKLSDWAKFSDELDFVDTVFWMESKGLIFHWDFYKHLHAVKYFNDV